MSNREQSANMQAVQEQLVQESQNINTGNEAQPATSREISQIDQLLGAIALQQQQIANLQTAVIAQNVPYPPTYAGRDDELVDTWLCQMEQYFLATQTPDEKMITLAALCLRDNAAHWWRYTYKKTSGENRKWNWGDFKTDLRRQFPPVNAKQIAEDCLNKFYQTNSVEAYIDTFQNIISDIRTISKRDCLEQFLQGLKPEVRKWVNIRQPSTLNEAYSLAKTIGSIIYEEYSPSQTSVPHSCNLPRNTTNDTVPVKNNNIQNQRLTDSEREKLRKTGGCFYCREEGHISKDCSKKPRTVNSMEPEEPRKKFSL